MKIHKKLAIAAIIALSITSLTACGGKDTVADTAAAGLPAVTGNAGEAPTIAAPTGTAPTTLQTSDIIVGSGTEVVATSTLTVHYTLMSWSNGAIVESSWSSGQPATFPLSGVIAGWQQGLPGAKKPIPEHLIVSSSSSSRRNTNHSIILKTGP